MIGDQKTGHIAGVVISMVAHEKPIVTVDGKPAQLAIITEDGTVIASGKQVSTEVAAVVINCYRAMWKAQGHLATEAASGACQLFLGTCDLVKNAAAVFKQQLTGFGGAGASPISF